MAPKHPVTAAIRTLRTHGIPFEPMLYSYKKRGGSAHGAACLGVDEHIVVKTLVFEDEDATPLIVLMHGDRQVSTKQLARHLGVKRIRPCEPAVAQHHTGYQTGGTSPFGLRRTIPMFIEHTLLDVPDIWLNGGKRGFLVRIASSDLMRILNPEVVSVATGG